MSLCHEHSNDDILHKLLLIESLSKAYTHRINRKKIRETYIWMNKMIELQCFEETSPLEKISTLFREIVRITPELGNEPFVAYITNNNVV